MPDRIQYDESDPRHHTQTLKQTLKDTAQHTREDVSKISDPKDQALFETSAEFCWAFQTPSRILSKSAKKHGKSPAQADSGILNIDHPGRLSAA
jgi:hypothetical protein